MINTKNELFTISHSAEQKGDKYELKPLPTIQTLVQKNRQQKMLTQVALAKSAGLTTTEISRIESGQTKKPSKKILRKLSPHLGVPYEDLLLISGHSGIMEEYSYFTKNNIPIPTDKVLRDVYLADSDLLNELQDINILSPTDIDLLKKLIILMKSLSNTAEDKGSYTIINNLFITTKNYLLDHIALILQLLSHSSFYN